MPPRQPLHSAAKATRAKRHIHTYHELRSKHDMCCSANVWCFGPRQQPGNRNHDASGAACTPLEAAHVPRAPSLSSHLFTRAHVVHTTCIPRATHVHITCTPRASHMHIPCTPRAHHVHTSCTPRAHHVHHTCTPRAHHVHTTCTPRAHHVHIPCTPCAHPVHPTCTKPKTQPVPLRRCVCRGVPNLWDISFLRIRSGW